MLYAHSASYTGKQPAAGFIGTFVEQDIFVILSIDEGVTQDEGGKMLNTLKEALLAQPLGNLNVFENTISQQMLKLNVPAHFSLAAGFFNEKILYVKTVGAGEVYFRRGKDFDKLMDGDKSASGYLQEFDCAVFTTSKIHDVIGENADIKAFIDLYAPEDVVERMQNEGYSGEEQGFISLFVEFNSEPSGEPLHVTSETVVLGSNVELTIKPEQSATVGSGPVAFPFQTVEEVADNADDSIEEQKVDPDLVPAVPLTPVSPISLTSAPVAASISGTPPEATSPASSAPVSSKPSFSMPVLPIFETLRTKKVAVIAAVVIFAILIWSVVFGYQRRAEAQLQEKVETVEASISEKLTQAEDDAIIDLDGALVLLNEAKQEFDTLKTEVGTKKQSDLDRIATRIQTTEQTLLKKEEKSYEEFYDLALENEKAKGEALYYTEGSIVMLDPPNKTVYVLDREQKSLDKYTAAQVSSASKVALYEDKLYVFDADDGVFEFISPTKVENVIEGDNDWGGITDIEIYNGNIYLLDGTESAIYKYLVAANGFGDKTDYFVEDQSSLIGSAADMVIDSSIYVASPDKVVKYTQGAVDEFDTTYPVDDPQLSGVYTDPDIEQIYAWSNSTATIYILNKNGTYERQIQSSIIKTAKGIFVADAAIYVFDGQKIYTIALN